MVFITVLLNAIGIICILISLIIITKNTSKEENIYKEIRKKHADIKYYYEAMDNILNNFSEVIDMGINKVESYNKVEMQSYPVDENLKSYKYNIDRKLLKEDQDMDNNETLKKIIELQKKGFKSKEIAKELNKGIREVDIIIKMMENN